MFRDLASKHWRTTLMVLVMAVMLAAPVRSVFAYTAPLGIAADALLWFLNVVLYLIAQVVGWLLAAFGWFANKTMQPVAITTATPVQIGWGATRDFANMFFILILLGIALDYILFQSFGVKRALPMLILVALLINFSLPIAGIFIDFANVFANFFMGKVTAGCGITEVEQACGFTEGIGQILGLSDIFKSGSVEAAKAAVVNGIGSATSFDIIMAIILMTGTAFVLAALGIMFLVRTAYLWALAILLPIVLVLMPFPKTSKYFGQWTNSFFKWTMFAPVASFFLYLSMIVFTSITAAGTTSQKLGDAFFGRIYLYVVVWFFLLGSLMAAQSMGSTGANMAMGMMKGAQKWAGGKVKNAGKRTVAAAGRGLKADERMESVASGLQKMGLGMLASGVRSVGAKTKMAMAKHEELSAQKKAELEALPESALALEQERYEKSFIPGDSAAAAHIATMRAKKGKLKVLDSSGEVDVAKTEALVRSSYEAAKKHKNKAAMDAILQSSPLIARKINIEEWDMDKREGKLITATDSRTGTLTQKNRKTGKTFAEVQRDVFDISRADFANMKGQWNGASVKEFIESGHLTKMHLKEAEEISDVDFTTFVREYYEKIDGLSAGPAKKTAIDNIKKLNPSLANTYIAGNLTDVGLGKPKNASEWENVPAAQTGGGSQQQQPPRQAGFRQGGMP